MDGNPVQGVTAAWEIVADRQQERREAAETARLETCLEHPCSRAAQMPAKEIETATHSARQKLQPSATIVFDLRHVTGYGIWMIRTIRHKGLKLLHEDDDPRGVIAEHADKLRDILARLDAVLTVADMDVPGRLHPLKGREKCFWAVTVRANWRVIFRFADHDAFDVDYVDYH